MEDELLKFKSQVENIDLEGIESVVNEENWDGIEYDSVESYSNKILA